MEKKNGRKNKQTNEGRKDRKDYMKLMKIYKHTEINRELDNTGKTQDCTHTHINKCSNNKTKRGINKYE